MNTTINTLRIILIISFGISLTGCELINHATKRIAGPTFGGVIGNLASNGDPIWTGAGVIGGAVATDIMLGEMEAYKQSAFEEGYIQARSDAIKEFYWMQQNVNTPNGANGSNGRKVYYTIPGPRESTDGRKFVPHSITIPIIE